MQLMKHTPWSLLRDIREEVNRLFDRELIPASESWGDYAWSPKVDIKEAEDKFIVLAEVPGVDAKDLQISIENNKVTLKGERNLEKRSKEENYLKVERISGTFYRQLNLPESLNSEEANAILHHGLLEISIPKKEAHTPKQVEIPIQEA